MTVDSHTKDRAEQVALATFLSHWEGSEVGGFSYDEVLKSLHEGSLDPGYVWEPFERYDQEYLAGCIETLYKVIIHNFTALPKPMDSDD